MSLTGGFLIRVDFLTGGALLEVIESEVSFATVDEKIQSSSADNSACELCSVTIPFRN